MAERPVVCVDLDSTLCDTRHRQPMVAPQADGAPPDWVAYSLACSGDVPVEGVCALVRILATSHRIVILSARDVSARELTATWLADHRVPYDDLLLGSDDLYGGGLAAYKVRRIQRIIDAGAPVELMVDDDPAVASALAAVDVPVLTVRPPAT